MFWHSSARAVMKDGVNVEREIRLDISGLGILMLSPSAASHISEGEDYLSDHYMTGEQVQKHIQAGTIVGFGTGSSGTFILELAKGYPSEEELAASEFKLRLGIEVKDGRVCFRDLYELLSWTADCPEDRTWSMENGFYHITLCSNTPESGILGDEQRIAIYFNRLPAFPRLANLGVPHLCERR
jgi:hypothetical protein